MTLGPFVMGVGILLLAVGAAFGVYMLWVRLPVLKTRLRRRLHGLRRHEVGQWAWSFLMGGGRGDTAPDLSWVDAPLGTDPFVIGRHVSMAEGYDEGHAERIAELCRHLARALKLPPDVVASLVEAAHLHDAGLEEMGLYLGFPGGLYSEVQTQLQHHCARGERLASEITPDPRTALWIRWHHERFDGSGYPDGLIADEIPLPAQVLGLADTYEALTHNRSYRSALDPQDALTEIQRLAGIEFDPQLVAIFVGEKARGVADCIETILIR